MKHQQAVANEVVQLTLILVMLKVMVRMRTSIRRSPSDMLESGRSVNHDTLPAGYKNSFSNLGIHSNLGIFQI
jgi:hypothetical protein